MTIEFKINNLKLNNMSIETIFCDNYFPPTIIECNKWKDETYTNYTNYREPSDGKYNESVFGLWRVKYKKLNPEYYCDGQCDVYNYC